MTTGNPEEKPRTAPAEGDNDREDTTPEIAADDAGASAMAERKAKKLEQREKS
ncbi:hypothetical protein [Brevundimonas sp.]|uniref:hypothetical protein n=1 Tax=Brevundimonas sp. TaxID=1871086 RepID=UPI0025BC0597|nr:hypothetical protein [Brevundimonas sp.]